MGKSAKKHITRLIGVIIRTSWRMKRRRRWRTLSWAEILKDFTGKTNDLLHSPLSVSWKTAALLNSVREENLEDENSVNHDQELECRRGAPQSAEARSRIRSSALPPAVPPSAAQERRGSARKACGRSSAPRCAAATPPAAAPPTVVLAASR